MAADGQGLPKWVGLKILNALEKVAFSKHMLAAGWKQTAHYWLLEIYSIQIYTKDFWLVCIIENSYLNRGNKFMLCHELNNRSSCNFLSIFCDKLHDWLIDIPSQSIEIIVGATWLFVSYNNSSRFESTFLELIVSLPLIYYYYQSRSYYAKD